MSSSEKHPIIFVHGAGTTSGVWVYWQRRLTAEGWPTYNMDLRGHGDSDWSKDKDYSNKAYLNDLKTYIEINQLKSTLTSIKKGNE